MLSALLYIAYTFEVLAFSREPTIILKLGRGLSLGGCHNQNWSTSQDSRMLRAFRNIPPVLGASFVFPVSEFLLK